MRIFVLDDGVLVERAKSALPAAECVAADSTEGLEPRGFRAALGRVQRAKELRAWAEDSDVAVIAVSDGATTECIPEGVDDVLQPDELSPRAVARASAHRALRQELERLQQGHARLARTLSHDFQAPLRQVSQFVGLLRDDFSDRLGEGGLRWLEFIGEASLRAQSMTRAVRSYVLSVGPDAPTLFSIDDALRDALNQGAEVLRGSEITAEALPDAWGHGPSISAVFQMLLPRLAKDYCQISVRGWTEGRRAVVDVVATECRRESPAKARRDELALVDTLVSRFGGTLSTLDGPQLRFSLPVAAP
ncbi:MAG: hypothetical protein AAFX94_02500 [Myxococcota bacterium]